MTQVISMTACGQRDTHSAIRRHRESSAISANKWRRSAYGRARVCLINSTADYTCASVTAAWSVCSSWLIRTLNGNQDRYWCKAQEEVCTASRKAKKKKTCFFSSIPNLHPSSWFQTPPPLTVCSAQGVNMSDEVLEAWSYGQMEQYSKYTLWVFFKARFSVTLDTYVSLLKQLM